MKLRHKAYKFRIYPSKEQETLINKTFGCCRFVYNYSLAKHYNDHERYYHIAEEMYRNGQLNTNSWKGEFFRKNAYITNLPELKKHHEWLKEPDSVALQSSIEDLGEAYDRYYKKLSERPRFKSKSNLVQSYRTKRIGNNIDIVNNSIKLPKLGIVRMSKSREVSGRILNATISRTATEKYYVSLSVEEEVKDLQKTGEVVGIDLGITDFAITSDGKIYENPRFFRELEGRLAREQKVLDRRREIAKRQSKSLKDAKNYQKQRVKVAKIHEKIVNSRQDYLHKISTEIVKNHDIIGIEDLNVSSMVKNRRLSKAISELSWREFRRQLEYKADWYGKEVIAVARNFPSSQLCSDCGYRNRDVKDLNLREWTCPECDSHHDRDINASLNIKNEALRLRTVGTTGIA